MLSGSEGQNRVEALDAEIEILQASNNILLFSLQPRGSNSKMWCKTARGKRSCYYVGKNKTPISVNGIASERTATAANISGISSMHYS
jgi:hypothetical protein